MISEIGFTWNTGGSNNKTAPHELSDADREAEIQRIDRVVGRAEVDRATLIDLKGQGTPGLSDQENGMRLARKLGFKSGGYVDLKDPRLEKIGRSGGIGFVTRHESSSQPIDLGDRQGLSTVIDVGKYGLHVVSAYFDDTDEDIRFSQAVALLSHLKKIDAPTEINLEGNALRPNMRGASLVNRAKDLGVRVLTYALPLVPESFDHQPGWKHELYWLGQVIPEMNRREAMRVFEMSGFTDGDPEKHPTAPAKFPIFGVDYVLSDEDIRIDNLSLVDPEGASDHMGIRYRSTHQ